MLTPITSNGVDCSVLNFGSKPGVGVLAGWARNLLHSKHSEITFFASLRNRSTQIFSLILAITIPTPPCSVAR